MATRSEPAAASSETRTARSAPIASALRSESSAFVGPERDDDDLAAVRLLDPERLLDGVDVGRVERALARPVEPVGRGVEPSDGGCVGNLLHTDGDLHVRSLDDGHFPRQGEASSEGRRRRTLVRSGTSSANRTRAKPVSRTRMRIHRTTARGALLLLLIGVWPDGCVERPSLSTGPASQPAGGERPIVFPIVGAAKYFDDWGDPRGQGRHAGNDILTTWRSPAVAAEDGKIKFWTTSSRAGCMLYLYGASGTTYLYIHLNNDLTAKRDNRGTCVPGVAYATGLKNGLTRQGRPADRLQRRLRRRRGHLPPPLRGASEGRRRRRSLPVPERRDAAAASPCRRSRQRP